ncbi:hypothetical protein PFISCL1PPCAC_24719, partial [Pristionchus fissidentatus]
FHRSFHRRLKMKVDKFDKFEPSSMGELHRQLELKEEENVEQREEILTLAKTMRNTIGLKNGKIKELEDTLALERNSAKTEKKTNELHLANERNAAKKENEDVTAYWKKIVFGMAFALALSLLIVIAFSVKKSNKLEYYEKELSHAKIRISNQIYWSERTRNYTLKKINQREEKINNLSKNVQSITQQFDLCTKQLAETSSRVEQTGQLSEHETIIAKKLNADLNLCNNDLHVQKEEVERLEKELDSSKRQEEMNKIKNEKTQQSITDKLNLANFIINGMKLDLEFERNERKSIESSPRSVKNWIQSTPKSFLSASIVAVFFVSAVIVRAFNSKQLDAVQIKKDLEETKRELKTVKIENSALIEEVRVI